MKAYVLPALAGFLTGILSAWGIGGGTLLLLVMTLFLGVDQITAQGINLLYFLPTAVGALIFHIRNKRIYWRAVIPAAVCGCVTAALAAWVAAEIDVELLRKLFGGFLLIVGLREILQKPAVKRE